MKPLRALAIDDRTNNVFSGQKVLVVEDNIINQQVAKEILEGFGVSVTIATALKMRGGDNKKLYRDIAVTFAKDFYDVVLRIEKGINNRQIKETTLLVHTLKGLFGTLGVVEAQKSAQKLEICLTRDIKKKNYDKLIDDLNKHLVTVLDSIALLKI